MGRSHRHPKEDLVPTYKKASVIVGFIITVQIILLISYNLLHEEKVETLSFQNSVNNEHIPQHFVKELTEREEEKKLKKNKLLASTPSPTIHIRALIQNQIAALCIFHEDHSFERRALIRGFYSNSKAKDIDVFFVINKPERNYEKLIDTEQRHYKDLIILDVEEKSGGKTLELFSYMARKYGIESAKQYQFVMKTEDDSLVLLNRLSRYLKKLKKKEVYGGVMMRANDQSYWSQYMQGRGYFLSWDLVKWISTSQFAREHNKGYEDANVGRWLVNYGLPKNEWISAPGFIDARTKPLSEETILIHPIKDPKQWILLALDAKRKKLLD
eukprot:TRINITY_DN6005_c0_g1_i1.p1 TRINITY_DN6005_c0_g1~~TRINITY_DN6005_c0_g1_i1.p1  ORF type:complete len:328 (-),score=94.83 TRINITY_DN6005_c0_g1_i1:44-1027(-)